eukprot:gnl/MRDRNA2_/MRDRNA2_79641_c0_seq1.p1 gnl/MRDRNA2_/MRDRNA2_79641_c0~~gnl/MRDRNA2_/MRDRNA2_79641_c0_seq1.p1  ORF type:complete len:820 (+),score=107.58 gnl/MRDRNA2_/MRDRNA2_79641_c0_seq1:304-2460(+)
MGAVGEIAAATEFVFGTMTQRSMDSPMCCRMHYGHPDILDKLQMMAQGGISKASRGLHLSEDVFAGLDLTLRGGWTKYREYFHVGKGRDMGFLSILSFFAKLSMGTGCQVLSRQSFRLGRALPVFRLLGFFYCHVGYYLNQALLCRCAKSFAVFLAYYALSDGESLQGYGLAAGNLVVSVFGPLFMLFVGAAMLPEVLEVIIEEGIRAAFFNFGMRLISLSPVFFAFQSKMIAHFFEREICFGGAAYIPTGRGLAIAREPFTKLFFAFLPTHFADGAEMLMLIIFGVLAAYGHSADFVRMLGPSAWQFWFCIGLVMFSWLFAPFIFNPYQFVRAKIVSDYRDWLAWLKQIPREYNALPTANEGWLSWSTQQQMQKWNAQTWVIWFIPGTRFVLTVATLVLLETQLQRIHQNSLAGISWFRCYVLPLLPWCLSFCGLLIIDSLHQFGRFICQREDTYDDWGSQRVTRPMPVMLFSAVCLIVCCGIGELVLCFYDSPGAFQLRLLTVLHKALASRWLFDWCDWIMPRYDQAALGQGRGVFRLLLLRCQTHWILGHRFLRDLVLGHCLQFFIFSISLIPKIQTLHVLFLYHVQPLPQAEDRRIHESMRYAKNQLDDSSYNNEAAQASSPADPVFDFFKEQAPSMFTSSAWNHTFQHFGSPGRESPGWSQSPPGGSSALNPQEVVVGGMGGIISLESSSDFSHVSGSSVRSKPSRSADRTEN